MPNFIIKITKDKTLAGSDNGRLAHMRFIRSLSERRAAYKFSRSHGRFKLEFKLYTHHEVQRYYEELPAAIDSRIFVPKVF
jgi:hypothetical protein